MKNNVNLDPKYLCAPIDLMDKDSMGKKKQKAKRKKSKKTVEEQVTQSDNNSTNEHVTATHSGDIVATADPNIDPLVTPVSMPQLIPFNYIPNSDVSGIKGTHEGFVQDTNSMAVPRLNLTRTIPIHHHVGRGIKLPSVRQLLASNQLQSTTQPLAASSVNHQQLLMQSQLLRQVAAAAASVKNLQQQSVSISGALPHQQIGIPPNYQVTFLNNQQMNISNVSAGTNQTMPPISRPQLYVNIKGNIVPINENLFAYNNNQVSNVNENTVVVKEDKELIKYEEKDVDGIDNTTSFNERGDKISSTHNMTRLPTFPEIMTSPSPLLQESKPSALVTSTHPLYVSAAEASILAHQTSKYNPATQSIKSLSGVDLARINSLSLSEATKNNPIIQLENISNPTMQINKYMNQVSKPGIPNPLTSASQDNMGLKPNPPLLGNLPLTEFGLPEVSLETLLQLYPDSDVARSVLSNPSLYNIPKSKLKLPSFSQQYLSPNTNLPGSLDAYSKTDICSGTTSVTSTCLRSTFSQPNFVSYSSNSLGKSSNNNVSSVTPNSLSGSQNHVISTSLYESQTSLSNSIPSIMSFLPGNIINTIPTYFSRSESGKLIISTAGNSDRISAVTTVSSMIGNSVVPCSQIGVSALSPLLGINGNLKDNIQSGLDNSLLGMNINNQRLITSSGEINGKHELTGEPSLTAVVSSGKASGYTGMKSYSFEDQAETYIHIPEMPDSNEVEPSLINFFKSEKEISASPVLSESENITFHPPAYSVEQPLYYQLPVMGKDMTPSLGNEYRDLSNQAGVVPISSIPGEQILRNIHSVLSALAPLPKHLVVIERVSSSSSPLNLSTPIMTASVISDVGQEKTEITLPYMETDVTETNEANKIEIDGELLNDDGSLMITRKFTKNNGYPESTNNYEYVIKHTAEDLPEVEHSERGKMLFSATHGEPELSAANNVMLLSSANRISSTESELGRIVFTSDISPPSSRVGTTMGSEPPTPSSPPEEMEEGYDEDWQQDWQHCSSESDWQHCSSESDWQLGSSDPPLYSPNWKPTIPSVHDNSQDPINLSLFEPTMDFETLMSLDI